jgi:hypothetical protein
VLDPDGSLWDTDCGLSDSWKLEHLNPPSKEKRSHRRKAARESQPKVPVPVPTRIWYAAIPAFASRTDPRQAAISSNSVLPKKDERYRALHETPTFVHRVIPQRSSDNWRYRSSRFTSRFTRRTRLGVCTSNACHKAPLHLRSCKYLPLQQRYHSDAESLSPVFAFPWSGMMMCLQTVIRGSGATPLKTHLFKHWTEATSRSSLQNMVIVFSSPFSVH